jgi:hypothetical protein
VANSFQSRSKLRERFCTKICSNQDLLYDQWRQIKLWSQNYHKNVKHWLATAVFSLFLTNFVKFSENRKKIVTILDFSNFFALWINMTFPFFCSLPMYTKKPFENNTRVKTISQHCSRIKKQILEIHIRAKQIHESQILDAVLHCGFSKFIHHYVINRFPWAGFFYSISTVLYEITGIAKKTTK